MSAILATQYSADTYHLVQLIGGGYILGLILGGLYMAYGWAIPHENDKDEKGMTP